MFLIILCLLSFRYKSRS